MHFISEKGLNDARRSQYKRSGCRWGQIKEMGSGLEILVFNECFIKFFGKPLFCAQ